MENDIIHETFESMEDLNIFLYDKKISRKDIINIQIDNKYLYHLFYEPN